MDACERAGMGGGHLCPFLAGRGRSAGAGAALPAAAAAGAAHVAAAAPAHARGMLPPKRAARRCCRGASMRMPSISETSGAPPCAMRSHASFAQAAAGQRHASPRASVHSHSTAAGAPPPPSAGNRFSISSGCTWPCGDLGCGRDHTLGTRAGPGRGGTRGQSGAGCPPPSMPPPLAGSESRGGWPTKRPGPPPSPPPPSLPRRSLRLLRASESMSRPPGEAGREETRRRNGTRKPGGGGLRERHRHGPRRGPRRPGRQAHPKHARVHALTHAHTGPGTGHTAARWVGGGGRGWSMRRPCPLSRALWPSPFPPPWSRCSRASSRRRGGGLWGGEERELPAPAQRRPRSTAMQQAAVGGWPGGGRGEGAER